MWSRVRIQHLPHTDGSCRCDSNRWSGRERGTACKSHVYIPVKSSLHLQKVPSGRRWRDSPSRSLRSRGRASLTPRRSVRLRSIPVSRTRTKGPDPAFGSGALGTVSHTPPPPPPLGSPNGADATRPVDQDLFGSRQRCTTMRVPGETRCITRRSSCDRHSSMCVDAAVTGLTRVDQLHGVAAPPPLM